MVWPVILLLILITIGVSCNSNVASSATSSNITTDIDSVIFTDTTQSDNDIYSIDINIKKVLPLAGITFWLKPQDADLNIVETTGMVDVELYFQEKIDIDGIVKKGELIQGWHAVSITIDSYSPYLGAIVGLEYDENTKNLMLDNIYGVLVVTLQLPDGMLLTVEETYVPISEEYSCCGG
jgi:hypothetical protein